MGYRFTDSKEELIRKVEDSEGTIDLGLAYLNFKLQEEILQNQNDYNDKQLFWSRSLAIGTWLLVLATFLLVKFG